jgi:hypothetical protein
MNELDYTATIIVPVTKQEAFKSITRVSGWWTVCVEGDTEKINDVFTVRFGETFITITIAELIPGKKIVWHVTDCYKRWLRDKKEWVGTTINWETSAENNTTKIHFTHSGLVPGIECYDVCEKAWDFYVKESLFKLITEGKGMSELK